MTVRPVSHRRRAPLWIQIIVQLLIVLLVLVGLLLGVSALAAIGWGAVLTGSVALTFWALRPMHPNPRYRRS